MTTEDSDLIDVLTDHEVTEPRAWAAALELEVERERQGSAVDRLIDRHGDRLLDLAGAVVIGLAGGSDDPIATDGGADPAGSRRPQGSPQRQKFVHGEGAEAAQGGGEPDRQGEPADRSADGPDRLSGEAEAEVSR